MTAPQHTLLVVGTAFGLIGCGTGKSSMDTPLNVVRVEWLAGWERGADGMCHLDMDHRGAWDKGIVVPGPEQADGLPVRFVLRNRTALPMGFRYKIYYQNTSYKIPEAGPGGDQHPRAHENFYGSWQDLSTGFKAVGPLGPNDTVVVEDMFRIHGDPRDEAQFVVDGHRMRQARNPRTGRYRFMLVVVREDQMRHLPDGVAHIDRMDRGRYIEPFWYFLHGPGARMAGVEVHTTPDLLALRFRPEARYGVHARVDEGMVRDAQGGLCGDDPGLLADAAWQLHYHHINTGSRYDNVPVVADMDTFTQAHYAWGRAFTPRDAFIATEPQVTTMPCATVTVDSLANTIIMRNPATEPGQSRKENVGVRTRHAFTYGRYRVRCELPRMLNAHDVWNGLTQAIWLIADGSLPVLRRPCDGGYMATYEGGPDDDRVSRSPYAEIDFEILKTAPFCPQTGFPPNYRQPVADPGDSAAWLTPLPPSMEALKGMVMVSCTNWDMACPDPPGHAVGCHPIDHQGRRFWSFRWDHWYRAVTQQAAAPDAEIFGRPYWFEIDWRPQEITWRIGPHLDSLRTVAYMDETMTSIPDIPMQLTITQEFHDTDWWPGVPYEQDFIPFPAKDRVGRILEVIID
jgi:hypothetical protein